MFIDTIGFYLILQIHVPDAIKNDTGAGNLSEFTFISKLHVCIYYRILRHKFFDQLLSLTKNV